jgi:predicted MFS family arabinose efflux permease
LIDLTGFPSPSRADAAAAATPVVGAAVPVEVPAPRANAAASVRSVGAAAHAGLQRLLLVNWLLSSSWDVHSFVVPILGHERGFSASAIGLVLGVFATAVAAVRLIIPALAHRLREARCWSARCCSPALVFARLPVRASAWLMAMCAVLLGLALGAVQPMIMTTLHHLTPHDRHGEAIALRSMTINCQQR